MTTAKSIHELAGEAFDWFERAERPDGESFTRLKDGAPEWLTDLVYAAHGDMLPDDWRYSTIREALGAIHDTGEDADLDDEATDFADSVDVYTAALNAWFVSHSSREGYCDEAVDEGLAAPDDGIGKRIIYGQYMERREVFDLVLQELEELADES